MTKNFGNWSLESSFFTYSDYIFHLFCFDHKAECYKKLSFSNQSNNGKPIYVSDEFAKITAMTALFINFKNPDLIIYGDKSNFDLVVITGHSDGKIFLWNNFKYSD